MQLIAVGKRQRNGSFTENVHIFNWMVDDKYVPVVVFVNRDGGENRLFNAVLINKIQVISIEESAYNRLRYDARVKIGV